MSNDAIKLNPCKRCGNPISNRALDQEYCPSCQYVMLSEKMKAENRTEFDPRDWGAVPDTPISEKMAEEKKAKETE